MGHRPRETSFVLKKEGGWESRWTTTSLCHIDCTDWEEVGVKDQGSKRLVKKPVDVNQLYFNKIKFKIQQKIIYHICKRIYRNDLHKNWGSHCNNQLYLIKIMYKIVPKRKSSWNELWRTSERKGALNRVCLLWAAVMILYVLEIRISPCLRVRWRERRTRISTPGHAVPDTSYCYVLKHLFFIPLTVTFKRRSPLENII